MHYQRAAQPADLKVWGWLKLSTLTLLCVLPALTSTSPHLFFPFDPERKCFFTLMFLYSRATATMATKTSLWLLATIQVRLCAASSLELPRKSFSSCHWARWTSLRYYSACNEEFPVTEQGLICSRSFVVFLSHTLAMAKTLSSF